MGYKYNRSALHNVSRMRREATIAKQQNLTTDSNTRCTRVSIIPSTDDGVNLLRDTGSDASVRCLFNSTSNEAGSSVLAGSELGLGLLSFAASEQLANNKINNASL